MSVCRSCGARVRWARTEKGKTMPFNFEPSDEGEYLLRWEHGYLHALYAPEAGAGERYVSHFATCPDADRWRKPRSEGDE